METRHTLLRWLLAIEAILFVSGLPAWAQLAAASTATLVFLLLAGVLAGAGFLALLAGRPDARGWAWAAAGSNLLAFPVLTPVGVLMAALLYTTREGLTLESRAEPAAVPADSGSPGAWWALPVCLLFCWVGAWQVHAFAVTCRLPLTPPLTMFAGLLVAAPGSLLAHRVGRWLAGLWVGLRPMDIWSGWADPQAAALDDEALRPRLLGWALGGPLATLSLGTAGLLMLVLGPGSAWEVCAELAGMLGVCSLVAFLASILPWRCLGYRSDGAVLVVIARRGREYRRDRAVAIVAGEWHRGVRPRNWDVRLLRAAVSIPDLSRQHATAYGLNYLHCLDSGFEASARYWIGRLAGEFASRRSAVPVRWRLEVAFHLAAFDGSGRVVEAPGWRRAAGRASGELASLRLRCDAALALCRGDADLAENLSSRAERAVLGDSAARFFEFEVELIESLRERLNPAGEETLVLGTQMVVSRAV